MVGVTNIVLWWKQHTPLEQTNQTHKGVCRVTCVLAGLRAHYTTHTTPKQRKAEGQKKEESREQRAENREQKEENREQREERREQRTESRERRTENRKKRVVLDGGGARLADAATRHHLTQTRRRKARREENNSEQNKHQRTQTIQKTSTRQSTSHGHHALPSMRCQTPIQQQRRTQTQQC